MSLKHWWMPSILQSKCQMEEWRMFNTWQISLFPSCRRWTLSVKYLKWFHLIVLLCSEGESENCSKVPISHCHSGSKTSIFIVPGKGIQRAKTWAPEDLWCKCIFYSVSFRLRLIFHFHLSHCMSIFNEPTTLSMPCSRNSPLSIFASWLDSWSHLKFGLVGI